MPMNKKIILFIECKDLKPKISVGLRQTFHIKSWWICSVVIEAALVLRSRPRSESVKTAEQRVTDWHLRLCCLSHRLFSGRRAVTRHAPRVLVANWPPSCEVAQRALSAPGGRVLSQRPTRCRSRVNGSVLCGTVLLLAVLPRTKNLDQKSSNGLEILSLWLMARTSKALAKSSKRVRLIKGDVYFLLASSSSRRIFRTILW